MSERDGGAAAVAESKTGAGVPQADPRRTAIVSDAMSPEAAANVENLVMPEAGDTGRVTSVNASPNKGTRKRPVEGGAARLEVDWGVVGDAHAGAWHRQVSLLSEESIAKARAAGLDVSEGDFGENITTEGLDVLALPMGSRLAVGDAELEISQIGKVCHTRCAIYYLAGDCIFPREGTFAVVRKPGVVRVGDAVEVLSVGDGHCDATPQSAIDEFSEAAREVEQLDADEEHRKAEAVRRALAAGRKVSPSEAVEEVVADEAKGRG